MKKFQLVDQARTPEGRILTLHEHDGTYTIRIDGADLMSTRRHHSEEVMAEWACAHLTGSRKARVLIGGLGFGFTARAALEVLPGDSIVDISELMEAVIGWNENPDYPLAADVLGDQRVRILRRDVAEVLRSAANSYDAIILDVDNGPGALTADHNSRLYDREGVLTAAAALRPGGCLAYWSAVADPDFAKVMSKAALRVEVKQARAHKTSGGWHTIFLGRKPPGARSGGKPPRGKR